MNQGQKKKVYIETYGCQMNASDSEIVMGFLDHDGFEFCDSLDSADVVLVNTCSIRENAEQRIYGRLGEFKRLKSERPGVVVGVLGCMAERLKNRLKNSEAKGVGQIVDVIVGPDEYRRLPGLVNDASEGRKGIAVRLSRVETYDDVLPVRTDGVSAWLSVMRGCDKFCTFCVVPFTRGRERSRTLHSIVREMEVLSSRGFRDVTLLGQNVNSYRDGDNDFASLMTAVAAVDRRIRIRFTTSHPQDMSDRLIETIAATPNICKYIHLPVQSGSDRILKLMNRTYSISQYLRLVDRIKAAIPGVALSTDIISGFPTETDGDHRETLDILRTVRYDGAYTFKYSPREGTPSFDMGDDVPDGVKAARVNEVLEVSRAAAEAINATYHGSTVEVLVEGPSKKTGDEWQGRTDQNKTVIFPRTNCRTGDVIRVRISRSNVATLFGEAIPSEGSARWAEEAA